MAAELTIIVSRMVKEKFTGESEVRDGVLYDPIIINTGRNINIKGSIDWTVYNTGTVKVYLWDSIPLLPGQSFYLPKSSNLPVAGPIPIRFEGDYEKSRLIADSGSVTPEPSL